MKYHPATAVVVEILKHTKKHNTAQQFFYIYNSWTVWTNSSAC